MQFNVEHVSVEIQSRGRSVAEVQVSGVQASWSVRPSVHAARLAVHSLVHIDIDIYFVDSIRQLFMTLIIFIDLIILIDSLYT